MLVDALGTRRWSSDLGGRPAGSHIVEIDISALPAGAYRLVLVTATGTESRAVTIIR